MTKRSAPGQAKGNKTNNNDNTITPVKLRPLAKAIQQETRKEPQKGLRCNSRRSQQRRLLEELIKEGPNGVSTIDARHNLNIMAPAPRIFELRNDHGLNIQTEWLEGMTPEGCRHRVARYVLQPGKWQGGRNAGI